MIFKNIFKSLSFDTDTYLDKYLDTEQKIKFRKLFKIFQDNILKYKPYTLFAEFKVLLNLD